jgi:putative ABC transport system permease protein
MTFTNSEIIPEGQENSTSIVWSVVDPHYTETLDLPVQAGRGFEPGRVADSSAFLVNEAAVQRFGWQDPIGKTLRTPADGSVMGTVVGVVFNAHFQSLQHTIEPAVFGLASDPRSLRTALVRLAPGDPQSTLEAIGDRFRTWAPATPFSYTFVDAAYDAKYTAERQVRTLMSLFAGLAVIVACLGLLGLAAHNAQQRRQEIGIRKALGATVPQIVRLLSMDLLKLVGLAFVVGAPLAYWGLQRWLQDFAYQTDIGVGLLLAIGAGAALVAVLTVGGQATRAARIDPAQTLRSE